MIYERGSLERRWYVQEAFSQDDHVLNRLPLLKYSWAEIYSLIFHYLLPLLCILQEFSTSAAHSHFHLPPCRSAEDAFFPLPTFSSLCRHLEQFFFFFLPDSDRPRRRRVLGFFFFKAQGFKRWRSLGDRTSQSLLKLNRITSSTEMFVSLQTRFHLSTWLQIWQTKLAAVKKIQVSSVDWTVVSRERRYLSLGAYKWETKINEFYAKINMLFFEGKKDQFVASLYWLDLWIIFPFMKEF